VKPLSQSLLAVAALTLVVSAAAPAPAMAQPAAAATTTRSQATVVRIKADMLNEWLDLQRTEVVPALKKAGIKQRTVWNTAVGNSFEYTILTPFDKWAIMDAPGPLVAALGAEAAARLNTKLRKCIEVQRTYMTNRVDDVDIPSGTALVMRTVVRRVPQGKAQDYVSFYRADVFPALKKAKAEGKIAGATIAIRGAGSQANEVTTTEYYTKFADLDAPNPVASVVGPEANAKINAKGNALATSVQTIIRRRVADLGF
jgi:hypothetical protein